MSLSCLRFENFLERLIYYLKIYLKFSREINKMYFLGYVELFHPILHGFDDLSYDLIEEYYITIFVVKTPNKYLS